MLTKNKASEEIIDQIAYASSVDALENTFTNVTKVAQRLESTVSRLDQWFGENQAHLGNAIQSFDGAMSQIDAVLGMVDLNPPGLSILLTYVYCSSRSLGNSVGFLDSRDDYTTPNIRWIGVTNAMAEAEAAYRGVSVAALAAGTYTTRDDSRLRNLREHPRIRDNVRMLAEIAKMETLACKVEIDQMTHMSSLVALIDRAFKNKTWIES